MPKCKLCNENKKLCKAHIVPGLFIRYIVKNTSKGEPPIQVDRNSRFTKKRRVGWYDNSILCEECDGIFSPYDEYAGKILLDDSKLIAYPSNKGYALKDVDSSKLIKFFISLLWRAGICQLDEYVKVDLGPYENKLKQSLLHDQHELAYFSVVLVKMEGKEFDSAAKYTMSVPYRETGETNFWIWYLPNGYKVLIRLDKKPFLSPLKEYVIGKTNDLLILRDKNFDNSKVLHNMAELVRDK